MAAFKREDRPGSSFRNSGYDILPKPINRGSTGEYNDLVPPAALVGGSVQGDSYGSGHGYGEGSRNSFNSQLNHGMHAVTGRRGGGFSDGNRRPQSAELDPQQLERERALDLQQQALSLEMSGEPEPLLPTSPMGSRTPPFAIGGELDGYLRKDGQPPTPTGEKQEFDEIHMQRYGAPTSTATSPAFTAVNSIASEPSTEPLFQGNAGTLVQPQHISTIGEVFPSTVTSAPTSGDKEEYRKSLQDNFNAVVPTTGSERSDVVPPAIETSVILPPLPVATKPKY
ncbi:hypothetical protein BGZ65_002978 [Modicella reniformis]|uniref:Uncharacterized protein n=1 Tax=Modicella reniformis TaxID=1440133 RepID=A0A9P6SVR2_9FUNG|nr:hypothetical protein BGZ65_002978 [Modicella reniformis]